MVLNTKFEVGDTLFTIDRETMKLRKFTVKSVAIICMTDKCAVSYAAEGDDAWKPNIPEDRCFNSKEALFEFVNSVNEKNEE